MVKISEEFEDEVTGHWVRNMKIVLDASVSIYVK